MESKLNYSIATNLILTYIKDVEDKAVKTPLTGSQKKDFVMSIIKDTLPRLYEDHQFLIDFMVDSFILISNNPTILKAQEKCLKSVFLCCGC